jgi:hypothetical protein
MIMSGNRRQPVPAKREMCCDTPYAISLLFKGKSDNLTDVKSRQAALPQRQLPAGTSRHSAHRHLHGHLRIAFQKALSMPAMLCSGNHTIVNSKQRHVPWQLESRLIATFRDTNRDSSLAFRDKRLRPGITDVSCITSSIRSVRNDYNNLYS